MCIRDREWERTFLQQQTADLEMTFENFVAVYVADMKGRIKENTWGTKEHILYKKLVPYFGKRKMCDIHSKEVMFALLLPSTTSRTFVASVRPASSSALRLKVSASQPSQESHHSSITDVYKRQSLHNRGKHQHRKPSYSPERPHILHLPSLQSEPRLPSSA